MSRKTDHSVSPRHRNQDDHCSPKQFATQNRDRRDHDEEVEYHSRNPRREEDQNQRAPFARTREDNDDVEYQSHDAHRNTDRNRRAPFARTREEDDDAECQPRDPRRGADRSPRSSIARMTEDEDSANFRRNKTPRDGGRDAEIDYGQAKALPKQRHRRDDNFDRHHRPSVRNQRRDENGVEDDDNDDYYDDRQQSARRSQQKNGISRGPEQKAEDRYNSQEPGRARSPQKVEDDDEGDDFDNDYSDADTEVQSEDGSWRPITEDDLKGLRCRQQDNADDGDADGLSYTDNRRPSYEDDGRAPYTGNRCSPDTHQNYDDDDRARKLPPQKNKTRHDDRGERNRLETKNREMNVSLTPRGQHSPRSGSNVHSKKLVLDCRHDQDDIGALKWGFNEDGAYLKRLPNDMSIKFGLDANDLLVQINDKTVRRKSRREIETCWMDAQEEDDFLRLVLEADNS